MRVSKHPQERRAELIAAARALFDEKGVDKTRVSDIVRRVGVAQGVFYYYFASKAEVVQAVAGQVARETAERAEAILNRQGAGFAHKLAGLIELYIDLVDQFLGDEETSLGTLQAQAFAREGPAMDSAVALEAYMERLVGLGVAEGEIPVAYPAETVKVLLYGLRGLAGEKLPGRRLIYTVVEQGLGLRRGALVAHLPTSG